MQEISLKPAKRISKLENVVSLNITIYTLTQNKQVVNLSYDSPKNFRWLKLSERTGRTRGSSPAYYHTAVLSILHKVLWISSCKRDQNRWNSSAEYRRRISLLCRRCIREKHSHYVQFISCQKVHSGKFLFHITFQIAAFRQLLTCTQWSPTPRWGYQADQCYWRLFLVTCSLSPRTGQVWKHAAEKDRNV